MILAGEGRILDLQGVNFCWRGRAPFALSILDFSLGSGKTALLLGESGSGKSTLLSLICGTLLPDTGCVQVAGTDLAALSVTARDRFRAEHIGVIFQQFNLLPYGTVADNILLPLSFAPKRKKCAGDAMAGALTLIRSLGLPDNLMNARAATLSVGQQQRVAVARALIGQPPLIIADEPTSSLDAVNQTVFLDLLFQQLANNNASLLMVSHNPRLGDRFDHVFSMSEISKIERGAA